MKQFKSLAILMAMSFALFSCENFKNSPSTDEDGDGDNGTTITAIEVTHVENNTYVDENGLYYTFLSDSTASVAKDITNNNYSSICPNVVIPERITFNNCYYTVTDITANAFLNCKAQIDSITLPKSIKYIGKNAFQGNESIQKTIYAGDVASWCKINFMTNYSNPVFLSGNLYIDNKIVTRLVIPNEVDTIHFGAFFGCESLESVTFEDDVKAVSMSVFNMCTNLKSVDFNKIEGIGAYAFYGCTSLQELVFPDSVKDIYENAFYLCTNLETVVMSKNIRYMGPWCFFEWEGDFHFSSLYMRQTEPWKITCLWSNQNEIIENYRTDEESGITADRYTLYTPFFWTYILAGSDGNWYFYEETRVAPLTLYVPMGCLDAYNSIPWLFCSSIVEETQASPQLAPQVTKGWQKIAGLDELNIKLLNRKLDADGSQRVSQMMGER